MIFCAHVHVEHDDDEKVTNIHWHDDMHITNVDERTPRSIKMKNLKHL